MNTWGLEISRAIKEGKWLAIHYQNQNDETTKFWCAIKDINPTTQRMTIDAFNLGRSDKVLKDQYIYYEKIIFATVLENTYYEKPDDLIKRLNENIAEYLFLEGKPLDDRILAYYLECYGLDNEPFQTEFTLVPGLDIDMLSKVTQISDQERFDSFLDLIKRQLRIKTGDSKMIFEKLILNRLSINSKDKGILPVVYHNIYIDIENRRLIPDPKLEFNSFTVQAKGGPRLYLSSYLEYDFNYFKDNYASHEEEFKEMIRSRLSRHEKLDEMPYFLKMTGIQGMNLKEEFIRITEAIKSESVSAPLKSFFGFELKDRPRKRTVIVDSRKINKNQLRVVYNAINRNVMFVQGPPGTGKTTSIVNILHSCLFNDDTCLLASGNNEAVDHVVRKLSGIKYKQVPIYYPMLRLGRDELIEQSLNELVVRAQYFKNLTIPDDYNKHYASVIDDLKVKMKGVNGILDDYENSLVIQQNIHTLQDFKKIISEDSSMDDTTRAMSLIDIDAQIMDLDSQLTRREFSDALFNTEFIDEELISEYLYLTSIYYGISLFKNSSKALLDILSMNDPKARLKSFKQLIREDGGMKLLLNCFPIIISTIMSSTKLGTGSGLFDLLIIEEASQANPALSLIPMHRSKRACFIGDQNQLQPIVSITTEHNAELMGIYNVPNQYSYKDNSILTTLLKVDQNSKYILLNKHYRCAKKIIDFSNKKYYNNALNLDDIPERGNSLKLVNASNGFAVEKNTSLNEVNAVIREIQSTPSEVQVAVITPFRNQARLIQDELAKIGLQHIKVGSIHTFQGQESDKIIVSTAITDKTTAGAFDWVKNNKELINVMTTRAKDNLVVIADVRRVDQLSNGEPNDLLDLVHYMHLRGDAHVEYRENNLFDSKVTGYKQLNTQSELEFLKTITHLKSIYRQFDIKSLKKVTDVLNITPEQASLFGYANQAHFDFVLYDLSGKPLLVIEIMGNEHVSDPKVVKRDQMKKLICEKHNLKLITIPNENVRQYNLVKRMIIKTLEN